MNEKDIKQILTSEYDFAQWSRIIDFTFPDVSFEKSIVPVDDNSGKTKYIHQKGDITLTDGKRIIILEAKVKKEFSISKSRVGFHNLTLKFIDQANNHGILIFYVSEDKYQTDYRLSLICRETKFNEEGGLEEFKTNPKRYTYLLGENESGATAAKRLKELAAKKNEFNFELKDVIDAFSVEKLNNEFFKKYKEQYEIFNTFLIEDDTIRYNIFDIDKKEKPADKIKNELPARDFTKKLLGRLVFLYFLQRKGWMGVPTPPSGKDVIWEKGKQNFIHQLFTDCKAKAKFHSKYLSELFFNTLNNEDRANFVFHINGKTPFADGKDVSVPYLNGGLFDDDFPKGKKIDFPEHYFTNLFEFFEQYNFTIDENSPEDHEVGIDPEMLGHIFENLLEDNRDKGAYYTPKEVVHYMSQQSIIHYLKGKLNNTTSDIDAFIKYNKDSAYIQNSIAEIEKHLKTVKVCDPAIGSGAFPMGVLKVIFNAFYNLHELKNIKKPFDAAKVKKDIIQNSIYGVDLEKGAVDIARLRFWLALVVDETKPQPLPNLDYKIMQGNSVLEKYGDIDLSKVATTKTVVTLHKPKKLFAEMDEPEQSELFDNDRLTELIDNYFIEKNKEKKQEIHKEIDGIVINHIDKKLEEYENKLLIEIATLESKIQRHTERLSQAQKTHYLEHSKEAKLIEQKKEQLQSRNTQRELLWNFETKAERPYFLWHLYFKDVFDKEKFDIIIGNPPYIKEYTNRNAFDGLRDSPYYMGKMDIWYFFACFCIDILKEDGGIQCFIAQNNWITSAGAAKFRDKVLQETEILSFVDFGNYKVFQSAGIQTMIYVLKKITPSESYETEYSKLLVDNIDKEFLTLFLDDSNKDRGEYIHQTITLTPKILVGNYISFNDPEIEKILAKIITAGKINLTEKEVAQGIVAPQDYLNKKNADKLGSDYMEGEGIFQLRDNQLKGLELPEDEMELIKPFFSTDELGRYFGKKKNKEWIIYTTSEVRKKINSYPNIKAHLERFKKVITSDFRPYGLHRSRDERFFVGEKIMSLRKCHRPTFTYTDFDCYVSQTYFVIKTERVNLKYLTALLNSKLVAFWLKYKGKLQGNLYQVDKVPLLDIPIATTDKQNIFETLVDYILFVHQPREQQLIKYIDNDLIIHSIEEVIDHAIFEVYFPADLESAGLKILEHLKDLKPLAENEEGETVIRFYHWLNEQQNPIRNTLLKANILSKDLLAIINSHIS